METITLTATIAASRTDNFLSMQTGKSRSQIAALIDAGLVLVNGKPARKAATVKLGDVFELSILPEPIPDISPREMPLDIIYNGKRYAIINKPAGIAVHPAPGHYDDSLVNGLLHAFQIEDNEAGFRPGIVHRLDKDTSGLLIIAKDRDAREIFSKLFQDRQIEKYYMAIAGGTPTFKETIIEAAIARDKKHRQRMAVSEDGRAAKTKVHVEKILKNAFLADIQLFTGRTHQIRVHMKHIKHPLAGDTLYGGKIDFPRQALHAYKLCFIDPFTEEKVEYSAALPKDMEELIERLKK
ncbi:MAG: RluA family pseudouridine synthase [Deferribacteraceae bacterium]|jgi:23S rRNA pseudouridine1911/1915/1917 synthase|nr:RluA family pseudouridine synthase [Deferribacteraceae bacterium]